MSLDPALEGIPASLAFRIQNSPRNGNVVEFEHIVRSLAYLGWPSVKICKTLERYPARVPAEVRTYLLTEIERLAARSGNPESTLRRLIWHGDGQPSQAHRLWLVRDLLPTNGVGVLCGQWATGKTFVACDLAYAVMTGVTFAGSETQRKGGVLWLPYEGAADIDIRLRATAAQRVPGTPLPFARPLVPPPLAFWKHKETERSLKSIAELALEASERLLDDFNQPLALIVIDTLPAAAGLRDANDAAENQALMNMFADLSRVTGAFVLAVDHLGKAIDAGVRGSSVKEASADIVMVVAARSNREGNRRSVTVRKSRMGPAGMAVPFALEVVEVKTASGPPDRTCVVRWGRPRQGGAFSSEVDLPRGTELLVEILRSRSTDSKDPFMEETTVRRLFEARYSAERGSKPDASRKAFDRARDDSVQRGLVDRLQKANLKLLRLAPEGPDLDTRTPDGRDTY